MNVELYLKEMGQRMMERRKKLGLTQEALAEKSELTTQFDENSCCVRRQYGLSPDGRHH